MIPARELAARGAARLAAAGVPEAEIKAEWWVAEALGIRRDQLDSAGADSGQAAEVEAGFRRLEQHEPLQHVIGHVPFHGIHLLCDRRALVPRPETEELVSLVLACRGLWSGRSVTLADVGTGSGCIAIALAAARPEAVVIATDLSTDALELARASAERNGVAERIDFRQTDLLDGIAPDCLDAVVSNPPYIATSVIDQLERTVKAFDPPAALDGGPDGLAVIRRLAVQAFTALKNGGRLWLEIGDEQGGAVREVLAGAGFSEIVIRRDMYGQVRFAEGMKCSRASNH